MAHMPYKAMQSQCLKRFWMVERVLVENGYLRSFYIKEITLGAFYIFIGAATFPQQAVYLFQQRVFGARCKSQDMHQFGCAK